ncbi:MAG: dimethylsulfonioproprionate lyase family protein [Arenicellales bacterium]
MSEHIDKKLLDASAEFVLTHSHDNVKRFHDALINWGSEWCLVKPCNLPATAYLTWTLNGDNRIDSLLSLFSQYKSQLRWEQSYTKEDGVIGEDMLAAYGFAELIGNLGPFISEKIRCGIGVWGPNVDYPRHTHKAEEAYIVLSGSAKFKVGENPERLKTSGDIIFVESMTPHGFQTADQAMVVFYLWQAGDLRETSTFG